MIYLIFVLNFENLFGIPILQNFLHLGKNVSSGELYLLAFDSRSARLPIGRVVLLLLMLLRKHLGTIHQSLHGTFSVERTGEEDHLSSFEWKQERAFIADFSDPRRALSHHDHHWILQLTIDFRGELRRQESLFHVQRQGTVRMTDHCIRVQVKIVPIEIQRIQDMKQRNGIQREIVDG